MQRIQRISGALRGVLSRLLTLTAVGLTAACGGLEETGEIALVEGFAGLAAADEPRATLVGRDILGNGGNAVDAAVAMYFTMAVTLPSRAGIASGGSCVLFDNGDKAGQALVFHPMVTAGGGLAPTGIRAMAALHARQGRIRWAELLRPAENLARFGFSTSRALARDVQAGAAVIERDAELAKTFRTANGALASEGSKIVQLELSSVLSGIRSQGAAYVHAGTFAERFAQLSSAAGLTVTTAEIREAVPYLGAAIAIERGLLTRDVAYFPPPPAANGVIAAQLWRMLTEIESYDGLASGDSAHLFAEAAMRSFADRGAWLADGAAQRTVDVAAAESLVAEAHLEALLSNYEEARHTPVSALPTQPLSLLEVPLGSSLVAADRFGNAVACSQTLNGLFGFGRTARGTGIVLAAPPTQQRNGYVSSVAAVVGNTATGDLRFAAAGSGGSAAATALATVMLATVDEEEPLEPVMRAPRLHHQGQPDTLFYEAGLPEAMVGELQGRGHALQEAPVLGRVNALVCPTGIRDRPGGCQVMSDPRGRGLGLIVQ